MSVTLKKPRATILQNSKHERYAQEVANGASQTDAYELAGYRRDDGHASRLAGKGRIRDRIIELKERVAERMEMERSDVIRMLLEDHEMARERGQMSAAIKAL